MKINGERVNAPFRREIVFPRVEGDIVFTAVSVSCTEKFEQLCPPIKPKVDRDPSGKVLKVHNDSPEFKEKEDDRINKKFDLQVIMSLENATWETVDLDDPESWKNWRAEALEAGLSELEIMTLIRQVIETLQPTPEVIEEAKKRFLATAAQKTE